MRFQSFRSRVTLLSGGISLVLVFLLSNAVGTVVSERVAEDRGVALLSLATNVATTLADGIQDRLHDVELIAAATDPAQLATDAPALAGVLDRMQRARSNFAWLGAVDRNGLIRVASGGLLRGQNVGARHWMQAGMKDSYVGDVHQANLLAPLLPAPRDGGPLRLLDFAAPIRDANGKVAGVIGAHGNWEWAGQVIAKLRNDGASDAGVQLLILDRAGELLYRPPAFGTATLAMPAALASMTGPGVLDWADGERHLTVRAALPAQSRAADLGWTIVARQPETAALAAAVRARTIFTTLGMLAALCAMGVTWAVATWLGRPLRDMALAARRIERGDYAAEIPAVRGAVGTEVSQLAQALQGMTRSLLSGQEALRRANETLDTRVKERTEALHAANQELERLANRDPLTGLYNRRTVNQRLTDEILRHRRSVRTLTVILIDIDHFKQVNDRFGHSVGDDALCAVARCLQDACRTTDFVARYGGEEFLVLLPDTPVPQALHVGEMLRAKVAEMELPIVGKITVSLGLADAPPQPLGVDSGWTPTELLQRADTALYAAKACGRDRLARFEPDAQRVA